MALAIALSIAVESLIALLLAALILVRFRRTGRRWYLFWGLGVLLVFVTLAEESALDAGVWSQWLIRSYLVLVAVLVGILSVGSAELALKDWGRKAWIGYVAASCGACAVVGGLTPISSTIMFQGVVWGLPPTDVVVISSVVAVPSALLLIVTSLYGAIRERRTQLLFITAGTAVFSLAGSLYVASFPAAMVYAEFAATLLLFVGFARVGDRPREVPRPVPS